MELVQKEESYTETAEITAQKKKRLAPVDYVADTMEILIHPKKGDISINPYQVLTDSCVSKTLFINQEVRNAGLLLNKRYQPRMVCFVWKHSNNGLYLSYPGDPELEMDTYQLADHGLIDNAVMKKLEDIIECKKHVTGNGDIVMYHYRKMREDTSKKGKSIRTKTLNWSSIVFRSLQMDTCNTRLLGGQESDHTVQLFSHTHTVSTFIHTFSFQKLYLQRLLLLLL